MAAGDDFIGWRELFFPDPRPRGHPPERRRQLHRDRRAQPLPPGTDVCGDWDFPDYSFTYRTTRLPDVGTDFRSQLVAAMERSGIPVPGDAVAAGLRLLAAPVDREAEPAAGDMLAQR